MNWHWAMVLVPNCTLIVLSLDWVSWYIEDTPHYTTNNNQRNIRLYKRDECLQITMHVTYEDLAVVTLSWYLRATIRDPVGLFLIANIDNESGGVSSALALKGFLLCWLVYIFLTEVRLSSVEPTPQFKWILQLIKLWNDLLHFQLTWSCMSIVMY